jgi:hypothetical protein
MLRLFFLVFATFGFGTGLSIAQQPLASAATTRSEPAAAEVQAARVQCRGEADGKSLTGGARRDSIRDCLRARFPESTASKRAGITRDGKPTARAVRAACKSEVETKGLRGAERKTAAATCFKEKRPDLAARAECRKQAKGKGLDGQALKDAVTACVKA